MVKTMPKGIKKDETVIRAEKLAEELVDIIKLTNAPKPETIDLKSKLKPIISHLESAVNGLKELAGIKSETAVTAKPKATKTVKYTDEQLNHSKILDTFSILADGKAHINSKTFPSILDALDSVGIGYATIPETIDYLRTLPKTVKRDKLIDLFEIGK